MKISCKLEFIYGSEEEAKAILNAVEVDNYQFVNTTLEGERLLSTVESDSIPSLIHTLDDYLACVSVAERVVKGE
jgi:hypothetical protein